MGKKCGLILVSFLCIIVLCLSLADTVKAKSAKAYKARLATSWPTTHPAGQACHLFAAKVKEATKGQLEITVYDSGTLYGSKDWLEAVSAGSVEFGGSFLSTAERYFSDLGCVAVPYAFKGYEEIINFFSKNDVGKEVMKGFQKQLNVRHMFFIANGHVQIWTSKDIKSLNDLKGLKARTLGPALAKLLEAMEMSAITMPSEEVYQALQSGMIEAYISNIIGPRKFSYTDFSKVITQPPWGVLLGIVLVNENFWTSLPESIQDDVRKAASEVSQETIDKLDGEEAKVLKEFKEKLGGRVHMLTSAEVDYMKKLTRDKVGSEMAKAWKNPRLWPEIQKRLIEKIF